MKEAGDDSKKEADQNNGSMFIGSHQSANNMGICLNCCQTDWVLMHKGSRQVTNVLEWIQCYMAKGPWENSRYAHSYCGSMKETGGWDMTTSLSRQWRHH